MISETQYFYFFLKSMTSFPSVFLVSRWSVWYGKVVLGANNCRRRDVWVGSTEASDASDAPSPALGLGQGEGRKDALGRQGVLRLTGGARKLTS